MASQAQIDATIKAMRDYVPWDLRERLEGPLSAMARAALTAAAEVGLTEVEALEEHQAMLRAHAEIEAATIERCAQVAENYKANEPETIGNIGYKFQIAAAIRALKDKP